MTKQARVAWSLVIAVLFVGCGGVSRAAHQNASARSEPPTAVSLPWNPLSRQPREADTLYLFDASRERALRPGDQGGLIADNTSSGSYPWGTAVRAVSGRYREGMSSAGLSHPGYAWMPAEGLLGSDQFTIELWLRSSIAWRAVPLEVPFSVRDGTGTADLSLEVGAGAVTAQLSQQQRGPLTHAVVTSKALSDAPAGRWVEFAMTLKNEVLSLYVDGARVAWSRGALGPLEWSDAADGDGLSLLGADGRPTVDLTLSDLRISRLARTPEQRVSLTPPVITVDARRTTRATVRRGLLGVLHTLGTGEYRRLVAPTVDLVRTDKLLTATPIKAGDPDAGHPTVGLSKRFSYDWRVVDRTMRYIASVHATPYLSIDATPALLGGSVPPFSGARLGDRALAFSSAFPSQPPDNLVAYSAMVGDLVHHIEVEEGVRVPAWGIWNEPDVPSFWEGTFVQYIRLYRAVAKAVKNADPLALVGGPETGAEPEWIPPFIQAVEKQHLPLDFVSFHYYTGSVGTLDATRAMVDQMFHRSGLAAPPLIVGEWNWDLHNSPLTGLEPFRHLNYFANDWGAAFDASSLIAMQRDGVVDAVLAGMIQTNPALWTLATPAIARAPLNVYRMWSMLGAKVLRTTGSLPAGVSMIATRDIRGGVEILMAHQRYRRDRNEELTIRVNGLPPSARLTRYEIDRQHSDSVDAGSSQAALEEIPAPRLRNGALSVSLPARAVTLLVVAR